MAIPNTMRAFFHAEDNLDETLPVDIPILDINGLPLWLEHPVHGQAVDVAAIPLPETTGVSLFPISWRNPIPLAQRIGIPVKVIGYPFGYRINKNFPVWAVGALASEPEIDVDKLPFMLIDCRTRCWQFRIANEFATIPKAPCTPMKTALPARHRKM